MNTLITTIIPTYRRPQLLRRALRSVLAQTFRDFIVCVYDNASGDETSDIVADFVARDSRVRYYCHPHDIGAVENFNYGIHQVETPYFSMLSDDDLLLPEFYARAMEGFDKYPAAWAFCSRTVYYNPAQQLVRRHFQGLALPALNGGSDQHTGWPAGYYEPSASNIERMIVNHFINTGVVFKTEVRDTIGVLDRFGSDLVYMTQLANTHPFVVSEYTGGVWSVHSASFTANQFQTPADTLDFVMSCLVTLLDMKRIDVSDRMRFFRAFHELAGHLLVAHCVRALAEKHLADFKAALDLLRKVSLPLKGQLKVACADLLWRANLAESPVFTRLAALWLRAGTERGISTPSETDRELLEYIVSL